MENRLSKTLRFILNSFLLAGLPCVAFFAAYRFTDDLFQMEKIPYPFELFGVAYGLAAALWTVAVVLLITAALGKIKHKKTSPYLIKEKQRMSEIEILK